MSNETRHYFGAYLEIDTAAIEMQEMRALCPQGHPIVNGPFCSQCGGKLTMQAVKIVKHPTELHQLLAGDDEQLTSITPPSLYGKKIIAIANTTSAGHWLIVDRFSGDNEVLDFPTEAEIANLKAALETTYADVIATLRQHPAVLSVTVKAGYVLDTEY